MRCSLAVTDDEYLQKDEKAIPVDEHFLHRFMRTVGGPKKDDMNDDAHSVDSDEFDAIVGALNCLLYLESYCSL